MVDWLAGNRIRGTSTERTSTTGFNPAVTTGGGWKELGRSSGTAPSITNLDNKRYLMILGHGIRGSGGSGSAAMRFNNDSGGSNTSGNYSKRTSEHGNTDYTQIDQSQMQALVEHSNVTGNHSFNVQYVANLATKEKLMIGHGVHSSALGAGSSGVPGRQEGTYKWDNTTDAINRVDFFNGAGGDTWNTSSECVVLGWDPDDTHTTNFWEELASVEYSSGNEWDTGTFTAKKYLWIQFQYSRSNSHWGGWDFNNDDGSGSGYASRKSTNGAADGTISNHSSGDRNYDSISNGSVPVHHQTFGNMFVINNASNEKLWQMNCTYVITTGAGTAPVRIESVGKYANTVDQITKFRLFNGAPSAYDAGIIKVWGSN